jgi:hypothetical protein
MYIACKKSTVNLKLIDNLIVLPETSTLSMASFDYRIRMFLD